MESYSIGKISAHGVSVQDNDRDKLLSVGDEVYFNAAPPDQSSKPFGVTVTTENMRTLWYLLSTGIKKCESICDHKVPWISNDDYFSYKVDSEGTLFSVRFFGKCEDFIKPLSTKDRPAKPKYTANNQLLRPWSANIDRKQAPYVSFLNGKLAYIAVRHDQGIESPTFRLIKKTIDDFKPNIIILEGSETREGISPLNLFSYYEGCQPDFSKCGEPNYAGWLAFKEGIPIVFGEPTDEDVKKEFLAKKYTEQDLLGYYFLRYYNEQSVSGKKEFNESMPWFRSERRFNIPSSFGFTYQDFLKWYFRKTGKPFNPQHVEDPFSKKLGRSLLVLAQKISNYRDENITRMIADYLGRYDRVMVVYGAGHFATQRKVLEKMFSDSLL